MSKFIVVYDIHAAPGEDNSRADALANMIIDQKPTHVINGGDTIDFNSLSSYDKGKRSAIGRNYIEDIKSHLDFQKRMWEPVRARKKKMPETFFLEGNHENRLSRALDLSPEYDGAISLDHLKLDEYYDTIVPYDGGSPGVIEIEGILFAHFFISGIMGRPIGGEHAAHSLIMKNSQSSVQGHSHTMDFCSHRKVSGKTLNGVVNGTFNKNIPHWAGTTARLWQPGLSVFHNVRDGAFDFEWWSLERVQNTYG